MKKGIASLLLLVLIVASCKKPVAFNYRDIRNFKVTSLSHDKSIVSMDLVFYNPNSYGVNLKNVSSDIYIDSSYVGKLVLDTLMTIPKLAEFTLPTTMEINVRTIVNNTLSILFNNEVLIGAKGTARVGRGGFYVTIPFDYSGKQKLNLF